MSADRLLASVEHVGGSGSGPEPDRRARLAERPRPCAPAVSDARRDRSQTSGTDLWVLQVTPAALLRLDPLTLAPKAAPLPLSTGTSARARGRRRIRVGDRVRCGRGPSRRSSRPTRSRRVRVGGFPVGITVAAGSVWFVDRDRAELGRLDPRTLQPVGKPIRVGGAPAWLARADPLPVRRRLEFDGTVSRIDVRSGKAAGPPIRVAPPAKAAPALAVAPAGGSVWVSSFASSTLARVSASSTTSAPRAVIASSGQTAAANTRALPRGGKVVARIRLGAAPRLLWEAGP